MDLETATLRLSEGDRGPATVRLSFPETHRANLEGPGDEARQPGHPDPKRRTAIRTSPRDPPAGLPLSLPFVSAKAYIITTRGGQGFRNRVGNEPREGLILNA